MEEKEDSISDNGSRTEPGLLDETSFLHVLVTKEGEPEHTYLSLRTLDSNIKDGCFTLRWSSGTYIPLSTNLGLKYKRRMLYITMDFGP